MSQPIKTGEDELRPYAEGRKTGGKKSSRGGSSRVIHHEWSLTPPYIKRKW